MGKIAGRGKMGRIKKAWLDNIKEWIGIASSGKLFHLDRRQYAELVANLH